MNDKLKSILRKTGLFTMAAAIRLRFLQFYSYPKWHMLRRQKIVCLELGSGKKKGLNGWTTVDLSGADISHDLRRGIPLPNESVDRIYTSHMFEHIQYKELIVFIQECFRVLKKNGELSVCVPNAGLYIKAYVQGRRFRPQGEGYVSALVDTGSLIDQVNYIAYMDKQHNYMFDSENLVNTLKKVPFSEVRLRQFDEMLDLKSRDLESIYASAIK
jgi:ubiquinone/menaquinone biosynthesis C-methylase UbiE